MFISTCHSAYGKQLKELDYAMNIRGVEVKASDAYASLVESINNVYNDVVNYGYIDKKEHSEEYNLFHNPHGVVDGPW